MKLIVLISVFGITNALLAHATTPTVPTPVAAKPTATLSVQCADFLALLRRKPAGLEFVGCQRIEQYGSKALQADYRVRGAQAEAVEAQLVRTAGMPRLRFICCGWDSAPRNPRTQRGYGVYPLPAQLRASADMAQLHISMGSGETLVNRRSAWPSLGYFSVTALLYLESP